MLSPLVPPAPTREALSVCLEISSVVARLALAYVVDQEGWRLCAGERPCACLHITDLLPEAGADVLVVRSEPARCQEAISAVVSGQARSIVLWDEPETLPEAVTAVRSGATRIPQRAIELSLEAPPLSDRLRETLRLLAAGRSSRAIAEALRESESTAKRDITELLATFDAPNRTALVAEATRLGFLESWVTAAP